MYTDHSAPTSCDLLPVGPFDNELNREVYAQVVYLIERGCGECMSTQVRSGVSALACMNAQHSPTTSEIPQWKGAYHASLVLDVIVSMSCVKTIVEPSAYVRETLTQTASRVLLYVNIILAPFTNEQSYPPIYICIYS
jgi:hypothetical protein